MTDQNLVNTYLRKTQGEHDIIIIRPHNSTREELQELKNSLEDNCWDWTEISDPKLTK